MPVRRASRFSALNKDEKRDLEQVVRTLKTTLADIEKSEEGKIHERAAD